MMKVITLAILCSVIGALAQNLNCGNDGSTSLTSCLSNPNIRIEKVGGGGGDINHYRLSLNSRNTWWAPVDNWIECRGLCENCETLPGINNDDRCEQEVDLFLNGFCASATPQTETVTDTQTITNTQRVISISTARETETVTRISTAIQRETVVSTTTTTDTSTSITTTTEQNLITITNVRSTTVYFTIATTTTETVTIQSCSPQVNIDSHDTTITTTVCPSSTQHDDPETELKLSTLGDAFNSAVNSEISTKSKASITALGSLTGISIVVLSAVIIGWVWTCWIIKKKRGISHTTTSKNVKIETSETKGDLELRNNPAYETTTTVQPQSSINSPVELTVDVNPAYAVTKSKPIQQRQDESEPNYEVIPTQPRQQASRNIEKFRGQPNTCS